MRAPECSREGDSRRTCPTPQGRSGKGRGVGSGGGGGWGVGGGGGVGLDPRKVTEMVDHPTDTLCPLYFCKGASHHSFPRLPFCLRQVNTHSCSSVFFPHRLFLKRRLPLVCFAGKFHAPLFPSFVKLCHVFFLF
jgi:hypothetical protein